MKATIQIPDELYREVKAMTAREGRTVREVTIGLFERSPAPAVDWKKHRAPLAHLVPADAIDHSTEAVRESIEKKWNEPN